MKRRREVLIEIEREIVISTQQQHYLRCPNCGKHVHMLTTHEAGKTLNTSEEAVHDQIDAGHLHYVVTAGGTLLVCADSVLGRRSEDDMPRITRLLIGDGCEPIR